MPVKVYDPDSIMLTDAIFDEHVTCPRDGAPLTFLVGYEHGDGDTSLVAYLTKKPCVCDLSDDEIEELESAARACFEPPERPDWPA